MSLEKIFQEFELDKIIVEIYGLGYVGFPLAVRLALGGIHVTGIDVNKKRLERLENVSLMDSEIYLKQEFLKVIKNKYLKLENQPIQTANMKIGMVCVPTPIPNKEIKSDTFVISAVELFLKTSKKGDLLILESSIEIGTTEKIKSIIESNGFKVGKDFGLCFCPERIDPANKEWGIENIPRVIYCSDDNSFEIAKKIYYYVNKGNLLRVTTSKTAEIIKSFENAFRLVNISLVNELAMLCDKLGVNTKEIIDAAATKPFGFMPHYPGAGAGGHCIPKDPRFLLESAKKKEIKFDTIEHALQINQFMPKYIANMIEQRIQNDNLNRSVLICGLSYKANVEDMRDSPSFKIINELNCKNFEVFGYDQYFNKEFLEKYLIENHLLTFDCNMINSFNTDILNQIGCLCIVQHHDQDKEEILKIYHEGRVPFIYDCQNKIIKTTDSKTKLEYLGN